jgi:hypothetical protein
LQAGEIFAAAPVGNKKIVKILHKEVVEVLLHGSEAAW